MSVIGKKPFVNDILDNCSSGQLETLASLLDDLGSPTLVSLFGVENVISSANLGVSHVVFKLEQVSNKIVEGILVYIDAFHCGLFAVNDTTGVLGEFKIDPVNKKYWQILEHLTAEEFRQVVADFLGGGGGVALDYATNEEIDALFEESEDIPVESIEFTNLPEDHSIELNVDDVVDMSQYIEVSPTDATDKSYTLTTDAPSVLSINGTTITVLQGAEGLNANLTVTANDGSGCSDTMIVQVLNGEDEEDVPIESIRYTDGQGNTCIGFGMLEGETVDLWENLEITPSDATDGIEFVSSDDAVISVDGTGIATAVGTVGENAIITIRSMENANISTTVAIDISEEEPEE